MSVVRTTAPVKPATRFYLAIEILKKLSKADAKKLEDAGAIVFSLYRDKIANDILKDLEDFVYVPKADGENQQQLIRWITTQIPRASFNPLGLTNAAQVDELLKHCHSLTEESLQGSTVYQVTRGDVLRGFFVTITPTPAKEDHLHVSPVFGPNRNVEYEVPKGALSKMTDLILPKEVQRRPVRERCQETKRHAFVIDGHNLLYRSAFGNYALLTADKQTFIGGAVGVYHTLIRLCRAYPEYEMHFVFDPDPTIRQAFGFTKMDHSEPTDEDATTVAARIKNMPEYKANRERLTDKFYAALGGNLRWVLHFLKACGFNVYSHPNHEGDNILGSLVNDIRRKHENYEIIIFSTDTDMLQLVDEHTRIYKPKNRAFDYNELITQEEVLGQFPVGEVRKINWARAVIGDTSDNILSAYRWIHSEYGVKKILQSKPICEAARESDTLEEYIERVSKFSTEVAAFMESKFLDNLNLLTIIDSIPGIEVRSPNVPNTEDMQNLLKRIGLYKEIELFDEKVLPALLSYS